MQYDAKCRNGSILISSQGLQAELGAYVCGADDDRGMQLALAQEGQCFVASSEAVQFSLLLSNGSSNLNGRVHVDTSAPARIELRLRYLDTENGYHILPGFLFGCNNLPLSGAGHFPNLTVTSKEAPSCSPEWRMRTDRNAAPVAMVFHPAGGCLAIAGPPYLGDVPTGLIAGLPGMVGLSLGYRNAPQTFINKDTWSGPKEQLLDAGASLDLTIDLFLLPEAGREEAFSIVRKLYDSHYDAPTASISAEDCVRAMAKTLVEQSWSPEPRVFTGVRCRWSDDELSYQQVGGRAIAWVGGASTAYPLLMASYRFNMSEAREVATQALSQVAGNWNEASGLFYDAWSSNWQPSVNYWWSGNTNRDVHSAYTNAEACCYLLKADLLKQTQDDDPPFIWRERALAALETILKLQREDGHYGYSYRVDQAEVASWDGFAGCWWAVAMAWAFRCTEETRYLESASRALELYWQQIKTLDVWGTPMDTWKSNDEEGVLAFIRAVRQMHELTGEQEYLDWLAFAAEYEFLWRFLYNTRPVAEPLRSSGWSSCGGSITSVSNPHVHPMGLLIAGDLLYLSRQVDDDYYSRRLEDSLVWARNSLELYPEKTGYGQLGWTGERYCHSDGLLITNWPDGSPASTELSFNQWAVGAMMEGLLEGSQCASRQ